MIGLKRFIRPAFIVSVIGHVGALLLGLLFVGANSFESTPPEAMVGRHRAAERSAAARRHPFRLEVVRVRVVIPIQ
jgi:hypothetical protein